MKMTRRNLGEVGGALAVFCGCACAPAVCTAGTTAMWTGKAGNYSWADPGNWYGAGSSYPGQSDYDSVEFPAATVSASMTLSLPQSQLLLSSLSYNTADYKITMSGTGTMSFAGNWSSSGTPLFDTKSATSYGTVLVFNAPVELHPSSSEVVMWAGEEFQKAVSLSGNADVSDIHVYREKASNFNLNGASCVADFSGASMFRLGSGADYAGVSCSINNGAQVSFGHLVIRKGSKVDVRGLGTHVRVGGTLYMPDATYNSNDPVYNLLTITDGTFDCDKCMQRWNATSGNAGAKIVLSGGRMIVRESLILDATNGEAMKMTGGTLQTPDFNTQGTKAAAVTGNVTFDTSALPGQTDPIEMKVGKVTFADGSALTVGGSGSVAFTEDTELPFVFIDDGAALAFTDVSFDSPLLTIGDLSLPGSGAARIKVTSEMKVGVFQLASGGITDEELAAIVAEIPEGSRLYLADGSLWWSANGEEPAAAVDATWVGGSGEQSWTVGDNWGSWSGEHTGEYPGCQATPGMVTFTSDISEDTTIALQSEQLLLSHIKYDSSKLTTFSGTGKMIFAGDWGADTKALFNTTNSTSYMSVMQFDVPVELRPTSLSSTMWAGENFTQPVAVLGSQAYTDLIVKRVKASNLKFHGADCVADFTKVAMFRLGSGGSYAGITCNIDGGAKVSFNQLHVRMGSKLSISGDETYVSVGGSVFMTDTSYGTPEVYNSLIISGGTLDCSTYIQRWSSSTSGNKGAKLILQGGRLIARTSVIVDATNGEAMKMTGGTLQTPDFNTQGKTSAIVAGDVTFDTSPLPGKTSVITMKVGSNVDCSAANITATGGGTVRFTASTTVGGIVLDGTTVVSDRTLTLTGRVSGSGTVSGAVAMDEGAAVKALATSHVTLAQMPEGSGVVYVDPSALESTVTQTAAVEVQGLTDEQFARFAVLPRYAGKWRVEKSGDIVLLSHTGIVIIVR